MLKDMTDSRRTDQHLQQQEAVCHAVRTEPGRMAHVLPQSDLRATIISRHFWPPLPVAKIEMPGQLKQYAPVRSSSSYSLLIEIRLQDAYAKQYTLFKPDKRLRWISSMGSVTVDVELQDRTISATVKPLEAAFIELFSEKGALVVSCLCTVH